jgi:hypothetical protein
LKEHFLNEKLKLKFPIMEKAKNLSTVHSNYYFKFLNLILILLGQLLSLARVILENKQIVLLGKKIKKKLKN